MDTNGRDAFPPKTDIPADQISAGAPDDGVNSGRNPGATPPDGLDERTLIEIALQSDDPEWVAYSLNVLGTVSPVDEGTMIRLEKRALMLALDRMSFGNLALEQTIVAFIQRRIAEQPGRARPFVYPLLSFLGDGTNDTGTVAHSMLMRVATDRPEYFKRYVDLLAGMQSSHNEVVRARAASIVAVLVDRRPEYFPDTLEPLPRKPGSDEDVTECTIPEGCHAAKDSSDPELHTHPEENAQPLEREVPLESTPVPAAPVTIAGPAQDAERHANTGLRSLASSLARKVKGGGHASPAAQGVTAKASGRGGDEESEIIDSFSDITQLIKTGLPEVVKQPLVPVEEPAPGISKEGVEAGHPATPVNVGAPMEKMMTSEDPKSVPDEKSPTAEADNISVAPPAMSPEPEITSAESPCTMGMAINGDTTSVSQVDIALAATASDRKETTIEDDEVACCPIAIPPEKPPVKLTMPPINKVDFYKSTEQPKGQEKNLAARAKIVIRPLRNR